MNEQHNILRRFALGTSEPFTKDDYIPPKYCLYPLSRHYILGHFLFHHLDVLPTECPYTESSSFRTRIKRFGFDRDFENVLLGLYLYCREQLNKRLPAKKLRSMIAKYNRALHTISSPEAKKLIQQEKLPYVNELSLHQTHQRRRSHRPETELKHHAALYVLGQLINDRSRRVRIIGEVFQAMFERKVTRSVVEKAIIEPRSYVNSQGFHL